MAIEEPKFELLEQSAPFELRQYSPLIVAEVQVDGDLDEASSKGFRLIADYIFGNNRAATGSNKKIAMTAPVTVQKTSTQWLVRFVMPSQYTLSSLPVPNNDQITLREVPSRKMAVITFSGLAWESRTTKKTEELLSWLTSKHLKPVGSPELARYNPPWTLPFLRRNEVMVSYE